MPKDNEVDEKVMPVAWVERTEGGLTRMWSGDLSAWAHRPANPEPLYSAATVAELRAEVERARIAGIDACDKLTALWQKDIDRADAAERRVGELEDLAGAFLEAADARDNEETSTQYPDHERRLREYKAAREDLSKSLPGADPT